MEAAEVILLDTCVVLWLAGDPLQISPAARKAIVAARKTGELGISEMTLFEVAWLIHNRRIAITTPAEAFLAEIEARFRVLAVTARIAQTAVTLPASYPADPMDRLIGATALDCGAPVITADRSIRRSKAVAVIW